MITDIKEFVFIGVVVDVNDPHRTGRIKIRVFGIYDDLDIDTIPWATPLKPTNGRIFHVPDMGSVVNVIFPEDNIYVLEFWSAQHYNINLQKKLESLDETNYKDFISFNFDDKIRLYSSNNEGLVLDYSSSTINITPQKNIDLLLASSGSNINLGSRDAGQAIILGNNFLEWFDRFLNILSGSEGGAFIGNLGAPTLSAPGLLTHIQTYFAKKSPDFLSHRVFTSNNSTFEPYTRIDETIIQRGDNWTANKKENPITITINPQDPKQVAKTQPTPGTSPEQKPTTPTIPTTTPSSSTAKPIEESAAGLTYNGGKKFKFFPVEGKSLKNVTSPYNPPRINPITKKAESHGGLDVGAPTGAPIIAVADGTVSVRMDNNKYNGNAIFLSHGNFVTGYLHMSALNVTQGQKVKAGDVIGKCGSTGMSTGPHLHFLMAKTDYTTYMDPTPYLK